MRNVLQNRKTNYWLWKVHFKTQNQKIANDKLRCNKGETLTLQVHPTKIFVSQIVLFFSFFMLVLTTREKIKCQNNNAHWLFRARESGHIVHSYRKRFNQEMWQSLFVCSQRLMLISLTGVVRKWPPKESVLQAQKNTFFMKADNFI